MKHSIVHQIFTIIVTILLLFGNVQAQTLVNEEWVSQTGLPDTVNWSASTSDPSGRLIITGNSFVSPGNTDILTTKYDRDGTIIWQQSYNGLANNKDYGTAIATDNQGNVYVAGTITNTAPFTDFVLIKYDISGTQVWAQTWSGTGGLWDVPSCMVLDNNGNIFVGGATSSFTSQSDYAIVKFNSSGNLMWSSVYDYANLYEILTGIEIENTGDVVVTGASASVSGNYDYATIRYDGATGNQLNVNRIAITGLGLDQAFGIAKDNAGNLYVTGFTESNGNRDIQTIKITPSFGLAWIQNWNGEGLEDIGRSIECDNAGNIYLTGYATKQNGGRDIITIKYDTNGTLLWERRYLSEDDTKQAEGIKISVIPTSGDVYVSGTVETATAKDVVTLKYDTDGNLEWAKIYDSSGNNDKALSINVTNDGNVYVTGLSQDALNQERYNVIKYTSYEGSEDIVTDSLGNPLYLNHQLIINFLPLIIKTDFVDNTDLAYGRIQDVLIDSVIHAMSQKIGVNLWVDKSVKLGKIFKRLTTADSISITRLGDSIPIPKFWSSLLLYLPNNLIIEEVKDSLNTLGEYIAYAEFNHIGNFFTLPNDPLFLSGNQKGLTGSTGDINILPAWDINTGSPDVKIGVCDSRIRWDHDDFKNKVIGYDYTTETNVLSQPAISPNIYPHGNNCASIIGSIRNNSKGGAGIAGGDYLAGNKGCLLFSMVISKDDNNGAHLVLSDACDAIVEGAINSNNINSPLHYGLHVMNHSWGTSANNLLLQDAVYTAYRNGVTTVCASGNHPTTICPSATSIVYPASYNDKWVIKVGASKLDGDKAGFSVNTEDIVAPGSGYPMYIFNNLDPLTTNGYIYGSNSSSLSSGTSFSAPHVAGTAGLMISEHSTANGYYNPLSPEDVEIMTENYATSLPTPTPPSVAGYGRLNAGGTMTHLHLPDYQIYHAEVPDNVNTTVTLLSGVQVVGLNGVTFLAELYEYEMTYNIIFPTTTQILDFWERPSTWIGGVSNIQPVEKLYEPFIDYTNISIFNNTADVTAKTYQWHLLTMNGAVFDKWIPDNLGTPRASFSLHLFDTGVITNNQNAITKSAFSVYPNPATSELTIQLPYIQNGEVGTIDIMDAQGRLLSSRIIDNNQRVIMDIKEYPQGVYIAKLVTHTQSYTCKFVKI